MGLGLSDAGAVTRPHAPEPVVVDGVADGPPRDASPALPVLPALRAVLPGGLRRGSAVRVTGAGHMSLVGALLAGVSADGGWCAVVGVPELGVDAVLGMGAAAERLLLVDRPGPRWSDVVAAFADGVDLLVTRPPGGRVPVRRLAAVLRRHGCVLVVLGPWEGAALHLEMTRQRWAGIGDGHGHLRGRRARVVATGRGDIGRAAGNGVWLWLPAADGRVRSAAEPAAPGTEPADTPAVAGVA